jgi:hypothetical protein
LGMRVPAATQCDGEARGRHRVRYSRKPERKSAP